MRRGRSTGAVIVAAAAVVTLLTGCVPPGLACPAIGFVHTGPVTVRLGFVAPEGAVVAGCFGIVCEPAPLMRDGDAWLFPLHEPHAFEGATLSPGDSVRIVVTDSAGTVLRDAGAEVPYVADGGRCPAPGRFEPVVVS